MRAATLGRMPLPSTLISAPDSLDRPSTAVRNGLLAMGLLQGLLTLALVHAQWTPGWKALALLLILLPPLFMAMAVTRWRDARLWAGGAAMAGVAGVMAGWVVWGLRQSPQHDGGVFVGLGVAASLWWFVALPWFQGFLGQGRWRVAYAAHFALAWNNALMLALAALCVHLVWGVLWLWAGLFALVKVRLFVELFSAEWFVYTLTGLLAGLGLWLARTQQRPIQMMLQTLLVLGRLLLPLLAWVLVFFVLALLFTGVEGLWATRFAAALLMGVLILHTWLVNAVYQDGAAPHAPYARLLQWLVNASLIVMPVLATLACVAIGLRVRQYGWTLERVWAAAAAGVLWLYAVGYACAAAHSLRQGAARPWLPWLAPVNQAMSLLVLAVLLALQTPVLDGQRIGAASQRERLRADPAQASLDRLADLKWGYGRHGAAAIEALAQDPGFQDPELRQQLEKVRSSATRLDLPAAPRQPETVDLAAAQARIKTPAGMQRPQPDWWQWWSQQTLDQYWAEQCRFAGADCVVLSGDWDQDQQLDHLLCNLKDNGNRSCRLSARAADGQWEDQGEVAWGKTYSADAKRAANDALREGRIGAERPRWPQWQLPQQLAAGDARPFTGRLQAPD
ncbi:DUF4153 domain-containing protein [Comamonas antarctica]|uniref:DUF4153 domain-containing protein n=1 Tax=Comamonas antarctica TaxID=2743470 RepID=A0A6N1XA41_9BURK|nr:DUF4153 domain-containing protein [Comamonas antarctica]QKV54882.1 DUF4153 domain-containing protein [Comamonas antarctica]